MKKFIVDIIIFTVFLGCIIFLVKHSVPYYWGNDVIAQKIEYLKSEPEKFNTFFIGSSGIYRHIDPVLFDEIAQTNSYNLGAPAMFYSETEYIMEHFIKENLNEKEYQVIFNKKQPSRIREKDLHTVRKKYFIDFQRLKSGLKFYYRKRQYDQVENYILHYLENKLGIGEYFDIIKFHFGEKEKLPNIVLNKFKGFYSLDLEYKKTKSYRLEGRKAKLKMLLRKNRFNPKPPREIEIMEIPFEEMPAGFHLERIKYYSFRGNMIVDPNYYFDKAHFNLKGARKFTKELAHAYDAKTALE